MKKKIRLRGCLMLSVLVALFLLAVFFLRQPIQEYFFPRDYQEYIEQVCADYDMDPCLIMAVIREESHYDSAACSDSGACGLMQLMPDTAAWVIVQAGFDVSAEDALFDPYWNIRLGVWYLDWLTDTYYSPERLPAAIAAYNAGHGNVDQWLTTGDWDGTMTDIKNVPYAETRQYLQYVYRSYDLYKQFCS